MKFDIETMTLEFDGIDKMKDPQGDDFFAPYKACISAYDIKYVSSLYKHDELNNGDIRSSIRTPYTSFFTKERYEDLFGVFKFTQEKMAKNSLEQKEWSLEANNKVLNVLEQIKQKLDPGPNL